MKLIQYRILNINEIDIASVANTFAEFLADCNEKLVSIFVDGPNSAPSFEFTDLERLRSVISESIIQSYSPTINYSKSIDLKSIISCRFIIFEDEGLIRFCYSSNDVNIVFENLNIEMSDISNLLVESDLFDFF